MADEENTPNGDATASALAEIAGAEADAQAAADANAKLQQAVEIKDVGPCTSR